MEKSTFSILFVAQKGKLKANGKAPIMARITVNSESVSMATRLDVDPARWLGKDGRTPGRSADDKYLNDMLDNYQALIRGKYNELFFRGETVTASRLKSIVASRNPEVKKLLELFDQHNEDYKKLVGKETSHKTYTRYVLCRRRLAEFMLDKYNARDILLSEINPKFLNDFYIWLRTVDSDWAFAFYAICRQTTQMNHIIARQHLPIVNPIEEFFVVIQDRFNPCRMVEFKSLRTIKFIPIDPRISVTPKGAGYH